jgi:hypothetical protein
MAENEKRCPPKLMSFYSWQLRKRHHFWRASLFIFGRLYFIRALAYFTSIWKMNWKGKKYFNFEIIFRSYRDLFSVLKFNHFLVFFRHCYFLQDQNISIGPDIELFLLMYSFYFSMLFTFSIRFLSWNGSLIFQNMSEQNTKYAYSVEIILKLYFYFSVWDQIESDNYRNLNLWSFH